MGVCGLVSVENKLWQNDKVTEVEGRKEGRRTSVVEDRMSVETGYLFFIGAKSIRSDLLFFVI